MKIDYLLITVLATLLPLCYIAISVVFDIFLRGFSPFIPSRPWVIKQILEAIEINKEVSTIFSLSCGRSGFLHAIKYKYPQAKRIGVEYQWFPFFVALIQKYFRASKIKLIKSEIAKLDVRSADIIYSHLYPEHLEGLDKKFKFECKPGTLVISTGFLIPNLEPQKVLQLKQEKGRLSWLSKNHEIFKSKKKRSIKENHVYFYEI